MAVRIGDTLKQINNADFPIVEAMDVAFESGDTLQELYDSGALSGGGGASYITLSQEEYDALAYGLKTSAEAIYTYRNSAMGILDIIGSDYSGLNFDATEIQKKIGDPENLALLKSIMTKLG